jgi:MFS family permease
MADSNHATDTEKSAPNRKSTLGIVFLTLFLDLVGFSIIFPLFPAMLDYYLPAAGEGSGLLGGIAEVLRSLAPEEGGNGRHLTAVLFGGLLGSLYAFLQFVAAPIWGRLSDRVGRRPILLLTVGGIALSYLLWVFSANFWLLVLARLLGGAMAGNLSVATAVVADITPRAERAKGMAIVGIAFGLGMLTGPGIGGALSLLNPLDWNPGLESLGLNPFSMAAAGSLLLSVINLAWIWNKLPETRPAAEAGTPDTAMERSGRLAFLSAGAPGVRLTNLVYFFFLVSFSGMEFTLTFLATERFGFSPAQNGLMLVYVGLFLILTQGYLVRRYAARVGEKRMAMSGIAVVAVGLVLIAQAGQTGWFFGALAVMALGIGLASPTLSALVSLYAKDHEQGYSLGLFRSAGSLGRAAGPLVGAGLYFSLGAQPAYLIGGALLLVPIALGSRLRSPGNNGCTDS